VTSRPQGNLLCYALLQVSQNRCLSSRLLLKAREERIQGKGQGEGFKAISRMHGLAGGNTGRTCGHPVGFLVVSVRIDS